ncbi:hypothetical protein IQ270_22015 [Microcoleus sp. LEGE 07076]|nr:hypothetical protein [Microcoleus sp. LEGE 07076]
MVYCRTSTRCRKNITANLGDKNSFPVSFADVEAAAKRLQNKAFNTPVPTWGTLAKQTNCQVFFKCENFGLWGSFKFRGLKQLSSHDQKEDLTRQIKVIESFSSSKRWEFEIIADIGSGLNYHKKRLEKLLKRIM